MSVLDNKTILNYQNGYLIYNKKYIFKGKFLSNDQFRIDDLEFDINYLNDFLPTMMDEKNTINIISNHIKENSLENRDFGKIMGFLRQNYNNKIDMNLASKIIKNIFKE